MGVLSRAVRNISRRKVRALLVIIALGFSMAIMISIPAAVTGNQKATSDLTNSLTNTVTQTEDSISQTQKQIECYLDPTMAGYGSQGYAWLNPFYYKYNGIDIPAGVPTGPEQADLMAELFGNQGTVPMQESLYSDIASFGGVSAVEPILQTSEGHTTTTWFMNREFTQTVTEYTVVGVGLDSNVINNYPALPTNITAGRNLHEGDSGMVLLSKELTDYFGVKVPGPFGSTIGTVPANAGDTISVLGRNFKVAGIFSPSALENKMSLYMSLSDAQSLTDNAGKITSIRVFTESSDVVTEVANAIKSLHSELITSTAQERLAQLESLKSGYGSTLQAAKDNLSQTQSMAVKEIIVVVAATSLIVLFVMLYTVRERTKEIGTLKAIGFSNGTVMRQFMVEGIILSLVAGVVGLAIAFFAASTLSSVLLSSVSSGSVVSSAGVVVLDPLLMLLSLGAALLLGVLGSLYPAWRASRTRPAEAMRYE